MPKTFLHLQKFILGLMTTAFMAIWPHLAQAQTSSSPHDWSSQHLRYVDELILAQSWKPALDYLLNYYESYHGQTKFDYQLGIVALKLGYEDLALEALERVVLIQPKHAGAWLDLATLYAQRGDMVSSQAIITHLREHFSPSEQILQRIQLFENQIRFLPLSNNWLLDFSTHLGYVENANLGINQLDFLLTPPRGLPYKVSASDSQAARGDSAMLVRMNLYKTHWHRANARSDVLISVGTRQFAKEQAHNLSDVGIHWLHSRFWNSYLMEVGPSLRYVQGQDKSIGYIGGASMTLFRTQSICRYGPRAELEERHYTQSSYISSRTPWAGFVLRCLGQDWQSTLTLRTGWDQALSFRAGGQTQKNELLFNGSYAWTSQWTSFMSVVLAQHQDRETYSPFLSFGASKQVSRQNIRLGVEREWIRDQNYRMYVSVYYDYSKDKSNIPIFNVQDQQLFLGLRWLFQ